MEDDALLGRVLEEFVGKDPRYPFPVYRRGDIVEFLKERANE